MIRPLKRPLPRRHPDTRVTGCLRVLVIQCLLLTFVTPAFAHASLVSAAPAPGETVPPALAEIRLTFDEPLTVGSTFVVYAGGFQVVSGIAPQVEGQTLRASLAAPLASGTYAVQWKAVTEDGHSVEGSYQFGVSEAASKGKGTNWLPVIGGGLLVGAILILAAFVFRRRVL